MSLGTRLAQWALHAATRWPSADRTVRRLLRNLKQRRAPQSPRDILRKVGRIHQVSHNGHTYSFVCPNRVVAWRARTFLTKEPETIEWIDTFTPGDVLFDVGANIGLYTVYAASRSVNVMAFEPESQNHALVQQNIFLNGLADRVKCVCVAISDGERVDYLYLSRFRAGESMHNFGSAEDWQQKPFAAPFQQGVVSFSLDGFLAFQPNPFPTHIKIDVDGIEAKVIRGAARTLRDPRLKSLLVEFDGASADDVESIAEIERAGFKLLYRKRSPTFNAEKFPELYNYVFSR